MPEVAGRGIRAKWKTQGDLRRSPRRVESWAAWDPDRDSPWPSWRGGLCQRLGPSLYGGSHRIEQEDFSQKEKDPLGHFGEFLCSNSSSLLSTRPLASWALTWGCVHLISEGAETTGTTLGSVPSGWGVSPSTGECPHLILEGAETTGTTGGRVPSEFGVSASHLEVN